MTNARNKFQVEVFRIGWFGRIVSLLLDVVLFGAVLVFGAIALAVAVAFLTVIGIKIWWLQRQVKAGAGKHSGNNSGNILDAEYEVITTDDADVETLKKRGK